MAKNNKRWLWIIAIIIIGAMFINPSGDKKTGFGCTSKPSTQTIENFKSNCEASGGTYRPDITPNENDDMGCDCGNLDDNYQYDKNKIFMGCGFTY